MAVYDRVLDPAQYGIIDDANWMADGECREQA